VGITGARLTTLVATTPVVRLAGNVRILATERVVSRVPLLAMVLFIVVRLEGNVAPINIVALQGESVAERIVAISRLSNAAKRGWLIIAARSMRSVVGTGVATPGNNAAREIIAASKRSNVVV